MNGDKIAPPCVPIERRFKFTEVKSLCFSLEISLTPFVTNSVFVCLQCHEASLFPGRTIKIRTMSDTQNMGYVSCSVSLCLVLTCVCLLFPSVSVDVWCVICL